MVHAQIAQPQPMSGGLPKVNIAVADRVLLHLLQQDHQVDRYVVSYALTRPGIADACAQHPPNVSRSMRGLLKNEYVTEHTRSIRGDDRRQKTWQLTNLGRVFAKNRRDELGLTKVLVRDVEGDLLEEEAKQAPTRISADISILQVLLHAQHEGILTFGDIRFGKISQGDSDDMPKPGRLTPLVGAHATYHTEPPVTRPVHGRKDEVAELDSWHSQRKPCAVVHGIAGIGKSTLVAHWLQKRMDTDPNISVCWYPCQPWDTALGLATSLLHRFGIDESHDPYNLIETLPLTPGAKMDVDTWRRRLLTYLTDANTIRERFNSEKGGPPPYWLIVIDDIHHIIDEARDLLGALIQISKNTPLKLLFISRTSLDIYDRRDVHTRDVVKELALSGLSLEETGNWLDDLANNSSLEVGEIHAATGGHPLALELLELYGNPTHSDWLRFLDEEIITHLPDGERELLLTLAVAKKPVAWAKLAKAVGWEGVPPENLISHGLLLELEEGMWLHEAMRERLLRDVGTAQNERKKQLD